MKFSTLLRKMVPIGLSLGLGAMVSGCDVGKGTLPVSATILPVDGAFGATSMKAYACVYSGLRFFLDFNDGSRGEFTTRASYSSSNPAVLAVSGDVLLPISPGVATVTVTYLTFTRSIDVTVSEAQNLRIGPSNANLAVNSGLLLTALADLDGVATPVNSSAAWSFVTPNPAIATVSTGGVVTGVGVGTLTAQAVLPACNRTITAPVTVANLQSIALSREFDPATTLIVPTTERVVATGTLDNGQTQDLSTQLSYTSSDATKLSFATSVTGLGLAAAAAAAPIQVTGAFANPAVASPAIEITPVADSLTSITVIPSAASVPSGLSTQFKAIGTYASGATQDITRHVTWSSGDTTLATISTSSTGAISLFSGLASSATTAAGKSVALTATTVNGAGQTVSAAATLSVN